MIAPLQNRETIFRSSFIVEDMPFHPAWYGGVRGLHAEKLLRGKKPYSYLLRRGESNTENEVDYYVSFVLPDSSIKHQPFTITVAHEGWYYENGGGGGPLTHETIDDVLHLMMHCDRGVPVAVL